MRTIGPSGFQGAAVRVIIFTGGLPDVFIRHFSVEEIIGMASAQLVISTAQGALSVWVEDMVVDLQYQDRGIGKQLLNRIEEWATTKGATRMQLLVDNENSSAIGYYSHLGWETTRLQARRKFI